MTEGFTTRIANRIRSGRGAAVVGLDPRLDAFPESVASGGTPAERIVAFYREALRRIAGHAVAVKPNIAFFERYGSAGYGAYEAVCAIARQSDLPVIGDIKRGDIGSTAQAYAEEHFRHADAVTLHPYLGKDSVEPFLEHCRAGGRAVFVLVHTSNPSAIDFQERVLRAAPDSGSTAAPTLSEAVADAVDDWGRETEDAHGYSAVGAVVGATYPDQITALRRRMPRAWMLIPGVGAQGGAISELGPAFDSNGLGALVNQSRGVMQCFEPADTDWLDRIEAAVREFSDELRMVAASESHP